MINIEVLSESRAGSHVVISFSNGELSESYQKACEYQELVLQYKAYAKCLLVAEPTRVHAIASNIDEFQDSAFEKINELQSIRL
jgi:hypothetical protein